MMWNIASRSTSRHLRRQMSQNGGALLKRKVLEQQQQQHLVGAALMMVREKSTVAERKSLEDLIDTNGKVAGSTSSLLEEDEEEGAWGDDEDDVHDWEANDGKPEGEEGDLDNFDLSPKLRATLEKHGITKLFPVQIATFESVQGGQDMIVRSRTGSGKTMGFALPIIDLMYKEGLQARSRQPSAIVLAPTRELALQVHREFERLAPGLKCVSVYGGASINPQISNLRRGAHVVVGTPGRVLDLMDQGHLELSQVKSVVLDEADEMLKMGFKDQMEMVFQQLPEKDQRQTLLFSATVSPEIRRIAGNLLNNGELIDLVGDENVKIPSDIEMIKMPAHGNHRFDALQSILEVFLPKKKEGGASGRVLVFASTKLTADEIAVHPGISKLVKSAALHGDMQQKARELALDAFRDGTVQVLVATDVAARGLDIPEVDLVIHFSIPNDIDSFVHRSGRTGRAGRKGTNIVLFDQREENDIEELENHCRMKFKRMPVPTSSMIEEKRRKDLVNTLKEVDESQINRFHNQAKQLIQDHLAKDQQQGEDGEHEVAPVAVPETMSKLFAAALAMNAINSATVDFSVLSGKPGVQTLALTGLDYLHDGKSKRRPNVFEAKMGVEDVVAEAVEKLQRGTKNMLRRTPGVMADRGSSFVHDLRFSRECPTMFVDVHPELASILVSKPIGGATFEPVQDDIPLLHRAERSSGGRGGRGGQGQRRGGGRGGFPPNTFHGHRGGGRGGYGGHGGRGGRNHQNNDNFYGGGRNNYNNNNRRGGDFGRGGRGGHGGRGGRNFDNDDFF